MSSVSAGLVKATNLTVTGTQSGAVEVTNLTAGNVSATNLNASNLSLDNTMSATNFFSSQQIAEDRWHLPTPTGPFAVDIIPMGIQNMEFITDIFGIYSAKYWGNVSYKDHMNVTIFAPSNRTGAAKNVSASLTGCFDPTSSIDTSNGGIYPRATLANGNCLYHPDDFAFMCAYNNTHGGINGIDDSSGSYVGWSDSLSAFGSKFKQKCQAYGGNNTIDSSANVRQELKDLWAVVRNTTTYKNLYQHFSIKTGKIWYTPQGVSLANGYKDFTMSRPTDNLLVADTSCVLLNTSWTTAELPTRDQIYQATGDASGCPVVFKLNGVTSNEAQSSDVWHATELASRGYIVIQLGSYPYSYDPSYKLSTNQTFIDALFNGYLGDNTNFDFTNKNSSVFPKMFSMFTTNTNQYDYDKYVQNSVVSTSTVQMNYNNTAQTNPNPFGVTCAFNVDTGNGLLYKDENGRTGTASNSTDICNIYMSMRYAAITSHTDSSGNVSWNNYTTCEKWIYAMKYCLSFAGLDAYCDFKKTGAFIVSAAGTFYPMMQNLLLVDSSGNGKGKTKHLVDASGAPVYLFEITNTVQVETALYGLQKENQGVLFLNSTAPSTETATSYNYSKDSVFIWAHDNVTMLPNGFTVPFLICTQTGPSLFYTSVQLDRSTESIHYALAKTRLTNASVLDRSFVYYNGQKHFTGYDNLYGIPTTNQWETVVPEYALCFSGGWNWPVSQVFDNFMYPNANTSKYNGLATIQEQVLVNDLVKTPLYVIWTIHVQGLDTVARNDGSYQEYGVSIELLMEYGNRAPGRLVNGTMEIDAFPFIDSLYRYVGPHKIETLRDSSAHNHLSLDFGKSVLFENNNNQLEICPRPGYNANLVIDGSGGSITINGVSITASQWDYLVNTVLAGH